MKEVGKYMTFREAIMKLRATEKLSQKEFANKIGVSRSSVARWESGKNSPSPAQIEKIKNIFQISLDELQ